MENRTMMKLIVATEAIFFMALIMAYIYMSYTRGFEPHETSELSFGPSAVFTAILATSSFTFWMSERSLKKSQLSGLKLWLLVTIIFGAIFLVGQANEYRKLLNANVSVRGSIFGTSFFTLTGFHVLHVVIGLLILLVVFFMAMAGDFKKPSRDILKPIGIYWHFVDAVWLILFSIIYVLPHFLNMK